MYRSFSSLVLLLLLRVSALASPTTTSTTSTLVCNADNCLRALRPTASPSQLANAESFCSSYTKGLKVPVPTYVPAECVPSRISSACSCLPKSASSTSTAKSTPSSSRSVTSSPTITGPQSTTAKSSSSSSSSHSTTSSTTTTTGTSTTAKSSTTAVPPPPPTTVPPSSTPPTSSPSSSTTSTTSSSLSSTIASPIPTITFTGTIAAFASGTPVAIQDPSFEQTVLARRKRGINRLAERQSNPQTAAEAAGWTISRCGGSSCVFENYNSADGIWAFAANNGGTIYQDGLILTPGATYAFTLYWQATGGTSGTNFIGMSARLGAANSTDQDEAVAVGVDGFYTGQVWMMQSWPTTITPNIASYCSPNNDGTITCRLFIDCVQDPNVPLYDFVWYVDIIRVQELSGPTSTSTSPTPTATANPTCSVNPQSTGEVPTIGAVVNPSFEYADIVSSQLSIAGWTVDSCPGICDIESCDGAEDGNYYFKSTTNVRLFQDITLNAYGFYRFDFWVKNTAGTIAFALGAPNTPFDPTCVTTSCQMEEWNTHDNTWFYEQIYTTMDATTLGTINSDGTIDVRVWLYTQNTGLELDLFGATMLRPPPCPSYSLVTGPADGCSVVSPTSYFFNVDNPDQADNYAAAKSQCQAHCDAVAACQFWSIVDIGASTRCYFDTVPFSADTIQCSGSSSLVYEVGYDKGPNSTCTSTTWPSLPTPTYCTLAYSQEGSTFVPITSCGPEPTPTS
ncbi:hypothetical protein MMC18_000433 [Xylographa bjoerkii]|nr:hypothetical protein [Xylographa bjoerkii]